MKRFLTFFSVAVCAVVGLLSFAACGGDNSEGTEVPEVTEVTLSETELALVIGEEETLTATVAPDATNKTVSWSSDRPNIVTVTEDGTVKAVAGGTATVTATADGKSASCTVNVNVGSEVGKFAHDFTVDIYGSDESFTLYENRGKLTVIMFWSVVCLGSRDNMPYYNELAEKYTEECNVIAIHGWHLIHPSIDVSQRIEERGWSDYTLTFAQDNLGDHNVCLTYDMFFVGDIGNGCEFVSPSLVIVDSDGVIVYKKQKEGAFQSYEELEEIVTSFIE